MVSLCIYGDMLQTGWYGSLCAARIGGMKALLLGIGTIGWFIWNNALTGVVWSLEYQSPTVFCGAYWQGSIALSSRRLFYDPSALVFRSCSSISVCLLPLSSVSMDFGCLSPYSISLIRLISGLTPCDGCGFLLLPINLPFYRFV